MQAKVTFEEAFWVWVKVAIYSFEEPTGQIAVMQKFGIKLYRRRARKWRKKKPVSVKYPNLLLNVLPARPHHIWVSDFTEL